MVKCNCNTVHRTVNWAVGDSVQDAVWQGVYWPVNVDLRRTAGASTGENVHWAVFNAMREDPEHPGLQDFLLNAKVEV
jgi:hypothetical protein